MTKKTIILNIISSLILLSGLFSFALNAGAEPDKEYRSGQIISINGKNYLIANNKEFAEILEITDNNKLYQVSEVHGSEKISDISVGKYLGRYFLVVATGRYLYRYDISNPASPQIEFRRDMYTFRRGQFRIGSVNLLAENKDFIFGAGSNGVRSFFPDNLFVNKIYTFDKSYGVAADDGRLAVVTQAKGTVYDAASGAKLGEVDLENKENMNRQPFFDDSGNAYFPSDRSLIKLENSSQKAYVNPVPKRETFSYAVTALPGDNIYYVNGHGIAWLDKNFKKVKFFNAVGGGRYGADAWAVGIASARIGSRDLIVDFNKSSILLLNKDLKVLAQYKYKRLYPAGVGFDLKITPSVNLAQAGQSVNLELQGFWPNETVTVNFGANAYQIKVDNQGYAKTGVSAPLTMGRVIIKATGNDSGLTYQTEFTVL